MTTLTGFKKTLAILTRSKSIVGLFTLCGVTVLLSLKGTLTSDTRSVLEMIGLAFFGSRSVASFSEEKYKKSPGTEPSSESQT